MKNLPAKRNKFPLMNVQDLLPIEIPDMPFESNLITNFFNNRKIKQIATYEENKAKIAIQRNIANKNYYDMVERTYLHPYRVEAKLEAFRDLQRRREYKLQISSETLTEMKLKNHILRLEAKDSELNLKMKLKELGMEEEDA